MMATDRLPVSEHLIVPSGVSLCWPSPCRCVCNACAFAPHSAQHPEPPSHVQASCLERAWPVATAAFAGGLAASSAAPPGRRCTERKRRAKAEGKIKGRGTSFCGKRVCTWGWRSTRQGAAACRQCAPCRIGIGEGACFARPATLGLDGGAA